MQPICDDVNKLEANTTKMEEFTRLSSLITQLMEHVSQRNNVYHAIKIQVPALRGSYNRTR